MNRLFILLLCSLLAACGYEGMTQYTAGIVPPDVSIAAGPLNIIEAVNGGTVKDYPRDGSPASIWYAPIGGIVADLCEAHYTELTDARAQYDWRTGRFFVVFALTNYVAGGVGHQGGWCLSVSAAVGPGHMWYRYFFPLSEPAGGFSFPDGHKHRSFPDVPNLVVGDENVVLTGLVSHVAPDSTVSPARLESSAFRVVRKSDLIASATAVSVSYTPPAQAAPPNDALTILQPVQAPFDPEAPQQVSLVGVNLNDNGFNQGTLCGQVTRYIIQGPVVPGVSPGVSSYKIPGGSPLCFSRPLFAQTALAQEVDPGDRRTLDAVLDFRAHWIFLVSSTTCIPFGDTVAHDCIRTTQLNLLNGAVSQWNYGLPGKDLLYPAITVDANGNLIVVANRTSFSDFIGIVATGRKGADPPGTYRGVNLVRDGDGAYENPFGSLGSTRWGDHSSVAVDYTDTQEDVELAAPYAQGNNVWGSFIARTNHTTYPVN